MKRTCFRARWIFPVCGEPIENGTIEIEGGQITAVHDRFVAEARDLGNTAIIPGLVNPHTHLEFSDLTEPIGPAESFVDWIRALVAHRRAHGTGLTRAIAEGRRECEQSGVTCIGEIATSSWSPDSFPETGSRVVLFLELLGLSAERHDAQLALAREHLESATNRQTRHIIRGISPHAPFSVHPTLFHALVDLATEFHAPLAIHLAETEAELELLAEGTGAFVELLRDFGVWEDQAIPRSTRPLDYLRRLAQLDRALAIHCNYLSDEEFDFLAAHHQISVIYCPRTHAYFGHQQHPWRKMLDSGISLAIGTDSKASNPDLSLWRELLYLHAKHPDFDPAMLLQLGTQNGARALGLDREVGTLASGKGADMAVISLDGPDTPGGGPYQRLFNENNHVVATMCAGQWSLTDTRLKSR